MKTTRADEDDAQEVPVVGRSSDDRDRMEAFCAEVYPRLVGALGLQCGDALLAEELAQEALLRACQHWHRIRNFEAPGAWAYRVGVNLASNHFRSRRAEQRARERLKARLPAQRHPGRDESLSQVVQSALAELTAQQREAIILRFYWDLSVDETARTMHKTPEAVRGLTHRALRALRIHPEISEVP